MTSINDATDATARRLTNRISGTIGADAVSGQFRCSGRHYRLARCCRTRSHK